MIDSNNTLRLINPCIEYFDSFLEALDEGFPYYWGDRAAPYPPEMIKEIKNDPVGYIEKQKQFEGKTYETPSGRVFTYNSRLLWIVDGDEYIGSTSFTPNCEPDFTVFAGNVGYAIRPLKRRMGYATKTVGLIKEYVRENYPDYSEFVICCSTKNAISEKVILKAGGIHIETVEPGSGMNICKRYRIKL